MAGEKIAVKSELIGSFNVQNILAAAAAAKALRVSAHAIKAGIEKLNYVPGRLERIDSASGFDVCRLCTQSGCFAAGFAKFSGVQEKRIITVFGCGGDRDRGKRPLMGETATKYSDLTIITSDNPRREDPLAIIADIEAGIDKEKIEKLTASLFGNGNSTHVYMIVPERRQAIETAINLAQKDDIILIAGKGHEDYQIIGTKKTPFDDKIVAGEALKMKGNR